MSTRIPCSPNEMTNGMVWFPRLLDKIRLHARGELHADYVPWMGKGFDGYCIRYLRIPYEQLVERVRAGGTNEEILQWCFANGRELSAEDIAIWSDSFRKRGLRDAPDVLAHLEASKQDSGLAHRTDIDTFFHLYDVEEGRDTIGKAAVEARDPHSGKPA